MSAYWGSDDPQCPHGESNLHLNEEDCPASPYWTPSIWWLLRLPRKQSDRQVIASGIVPTLPWWMHWPQMMVIFLVTAVLPPVFVCKALGLDDPWWGLPIFLFWLWPVQHLAHRIIELESIIKMEGDRRDELARRRGPCPNDTNGDGDCGRRNCPHGCMDARRGPRPDRTAGVPFREGW